MSFAAKVLEVPCCLQSCLFIAGSLQGSRSLQYLICVLYREGI